MDSNWKDLGTHYIHLYPQDSEEWHAARLKGWGDSKQKYMLTASNFATATGNGYKAASSLAYSLVTGHKEIPSKESLRHMERGKRLEPVARRLYENKFRVKVEEVGLAIWKTDIRLGASLDGIVSNTDGCIEIKCPAKMYPKLVKAVKEPELGHPIDRIYRSHYDQMQGGMAITDRKWCDYVVYGPLTLESKEMMLYTEKIPFDEHYWSEILYPKMVRFFNDTIPHIEDMVKNMDRQKCSEDLAIAY